LSIFDDDDLASFVFGQGADSASPASIVIEAVLFARSGEVVGVAAANQIRRVSACHIAFGHRVSASITVL
jgi:hypothetical protein